MSVKEQEPPVPKRAETMRQAEQLVLARETPVAAKGWRITPIPVRSPGVAGEAVAA